MKNMIRKIVPKLRAIKPTKFQRKLRTNNDQNRPYRFCSISSDYAHDRPQTRMHIPTPITYFEDIIE